MRTLAACTAFCVFLSMAASAQQVFTDEALFLAASGPLGTESFECIAASNPSSVTPVLTPAFDMQIVPILSSNQAPLNVQVAPNPNGPHAIYGSHYVQAGATPTTNGQFDLTLSFAAPVAEFGLWITDFGDQSINPGVLTATVLGTAYTIQVNPPVRPDGEEVFWGLRAPGTPFTSVVLTKTTQGDGIGIDQVYYSDLGLPGCMKYCTAGTSASGCQAVLSASGTASAAAPTGFVLSAAAVEGAKDGLFFYGTGGRQSNSWGNGTSYQCVVPPVTRASLLTGTGTSGLCDGSFSQDLNALWTAKPAKNPGAGAVVDAQLWYRDPFNTSNQTTSLSDALEFFVTP